MVYAFLWVLQDIYIISRVRSIVKALRLFTEFGLGGVLLTMF